ncbi:MAG: BMP family ABC transporter substrate-binding protein [Ileibacterium sp.]|nr:BMP family ABC transporter substrate-binding protein [Ileibacterium sp.]
MLRKKLFKAAAAGLAAMVCLSGCAASQKKEGTYLVTMVTDTGGINDQSFNQSSWEGLESFNQKTGADVRYIESKQASDFTTNMDRACDAYSDLVWGIGFSLADSLINIASYNPDIHFAIVDQSFEDTPMNVTGVTFRAEESSFLAGYVAGMSTKTDRVGYIGAMKTFVNDQFEYGFLAGVQFAAQERGVPIQVDEQFTESYSDVAKAKAIANKMYSSGCDIIYHSVGGAGYGAIESAKENKKYIIGVDSDQSYLAPDNVLTSALKNVNVAVEELSTKAMNGEDIGGKTFDFGLSDNGVGLPKENKNMDPEVYQKTMEVQERIINGEIDPPSTEETYKAWLSENGIQ